MNYAMKCAFMMWLTNVDGMKDMWCSSTARLLSTYNVDVNGRVCGALVQLGCYQHRYEWKGLWLAHEGIVNTISSQKNVNSKACMQMHRWW